jgi:hypothetical protein
VLNNLLAGEDSKEFTIPLPLLPLPPKFGILKLLPPDFGILKLLPPDFGILKPPAKAPAILRKS